MDNIRIFLYSTAQNDEHNGLRVRDFGVVVNYLTDSAESNRLAAVGLEMRVLSEAHTQRLFQQCSKFVRLYFISFSFSLFFYRREAIPTDNFVSPSSVRQHVRFNPQNIKRCHICDHKESIHIHI